ncbi:MAG: DUF2330 domain-containing protein [Myxococcota bacterium]
MIAAWFANRVAHACGGFFCDNLQPVDQSGEAIVFAVEDGIVTTHVQIAYQGAADGFAWILPVPGVPEVGLSTDALFTALERSTRQVIDLARIDEPGCAAAGADADADTDTDADADVSTSGGSASQVLVISEGAVGPYETAVLQATDGAALIDWLQANGYGVPDTLGDRMGPYLAPGMSFLALKLRKDSGDVAGQLAPLAVSWPGDRPSIPLTLTSVAATPDMPLTVYVLGQARAVPTNYLHVQLNPLGFDWLQAGTEPPGELLRRAADEAGGRAFSTTFADRASVEVETSMSTFGLESIGDPLEWFLALPAHGFGGTSDVLAVLRTHVPAPPGIPETSFYDDPYAYPGAWAALETTFDPVAASNDLAARVVVPRRAVQALLDANAYVTRLESSISPDEMSVDPQFAFNPDLPPVDRVARGTLRADCGPPGSTEPTAWTLELPGGFPVAVPPQAAVWGPTLVDWSWSHLDHAALVVEQLSETGPGTIVADYSAELREVEDLEDTVGTEPTGCGCSGRGGPTDGTGVALLGGVALALRGRRSRNCTPEVGSARR